MHITIFVYGTWGDIRPHVVLGMALQRGALFGQLWAEREIRLPQNIWTCPKANLGILQRCWRLRRH